MLYIRSHLTEPQMASSSAVNSCTCHMFCAMGMGRGFLWEGKQLRWSANTMFYLTGIASCSHIFACRGACDEDGGSHMDRLLLDHFQWLMVILYGYMPGV